MKVEKAPVPQDICWKFLTNSKTHHYLRGFFIYALIVILFVFWTMPVTAISVWANLSNWPLKYPRPNIFLETLEKFPALGSLVELVEKNNTLVGIVEGFLPTLALNIFMGLLPIILKCKFSRHFFSRQFEFSMKLSFFWYPYQFFQFRYR